MLKLNKFGSLLKRFKQAQDGTMAVIWAVALSSITVAVGSAYDFSKVYTARQKSQHTADLFALAAAKYVKEYGEPSAYDPDDPNGDPNTDDMKFLPGVKYYLSDFGITLNPYNDTQTLDDGSIEDDPYFIINYLTGELEVVVTAATKPAFMSIAGIKKVDFSASSTVSYFKEDLKDPASIFLVLDNSGSMDTTDGGIERIDQLKTTVNNFMTKMEQISANTTEPVLRTALWAYSSPNNTAWVVTDYDCDNYWFNVYLSWGYSAEDLESWGYCEIGEYQTVTNGDAIYTDTLTLPDWGTISSDTVNDMRADGGTYPSGALTAAKTKMELEEAIHLAQSPDATPHKFVIFMTDGQNSTSSETTTSEAQCTAMRNAGVKVYTIGYGISAGTSAETFLKNCSYDPSTHFVLAANATVLNETFNDIGEDILEEVIRIRS